MAAVPKHRLQVYSTAACAFCTFFRCTFFLRSFSFYLLIDEGMKGWRDGGMEKGFA